MQVWVYTPKFGGGFKVVERSAAAPEEVEYGPAVTGDKGELVALIKHREHLGLAPGQPNHYQGEVTMSNTDLMIPEAANLPAYALDQAAARAEWGDLLSGMPSGAPPRIKLGGKQFLLVDASGEEIAYPMGDLVKGPDNNLYLPMFVLAARPTLQKAWYLKKYNPNAAEHDAPDCFSNDGERPDSGSPSPQCDTCAACPKNAFGSGSDNEGNASGGKACTDIKILAVIIPNYGIYSFKIPPGSFKNWAALGKKLVTAGIRPSTVKFLVGFEPLETYPVLVFQYGGIAPQQALAKLAERAASPEVADILNNRIAASTKAPKAGETKPATKTEAALDPNLEAGDLGLGDDLGLGETKAAASKGGKKPAAKKPAAQPTTAAAPSDDELAAQLGL
jgi:hypothetical protein